MGMITTAHVQAMLDVEAALAEVEASLNVIPAGAAATIGSVARVDLYDLEAIREAASRAGNAAIPLIRQLTDRVAAIDPKAAGYVHWGATSQDIIDTAVVLGLRDRVPAIAAAIERAANAAAVHARRHAQTPMAGRTWLQQATPITFGLKAAGWVDALDRAGRTVRAALEDAMVLQCGGAAGTLAALGAAGPEVAAGLAARLGLALPAIPWHAHRDRLVSLACALGVATGTLGKIARDLGLLAQTEVAEAHEPAAEAGGSSSMPHKQNPVRAASAIAAAIRAPGLVATMLSAMPQEHERGLGGWQAERETLPELIDVAQEAAQALAGALEALVVEPARMQTNLDRLGGLALAEAVVMQLAPVMGRNEANARVARAARQAQDEGRSFADVLAGVPEIAAVIGRQGIEQALSPDRYLGASADFIASVLERHRKA